MVQSPLTSQHQREITPPSAKTALKSPQVPYPKYQYAHKSNPYYSLVTSTSP
uniref:hypothetical protein n=1 Tax=Anabaena sp. PCC 7938 TaxID=1296340 RepID=UPI0002E56897|nr:hypothetical protein [Anabaena sp. CCAP 1446/1C]